MSASMIKFYDYVLSAEAYKVRLLLRMLAVPYEAVKVDIHPGRDHCRQPFLALNPLGTLPVLVDGDVVLREAEAILVYLALRHDPSGRWLPSGPTHAVEAAQVAMWLAFAGRELAELSTLRMQCVTGREPDDAALRPRSLQALEILDDHLALRELQGSHWVVGDVATIADLALFPTVALAPDAAVPLDPYPAIWRWIARVKRLPGFVVMPGIHPILPGER